MLQTIQPAQLPELKMFNPMAPLQAYYQGKNDAMQTRQQEQQMRINEMQMRQQEMQLAEYEQDAPYRQQEKELNRVRNIMETDQQMIQFGRQMLTGLDPEAEDFDQKAVSAAVEMERYLVERAKVRPETAEMVIGNALKAGAFSRESVMREQIKQGLRAAPGKEEKPELDKSSGQQFIRNPETGLYEAVPVSGFVKEDKTSLVTVNTGEGQQNEVSESAGKKYGEKIGEDVSKRENLAMEAANQNARLDSVALELANGARTGFGEEFLLNVKSLGQTLGIDTGDLSGQEAIRKVSNEMALRLRNPESGLGLTGNTSNKDLQFLKDSVVGLGRTESGNRAIIKAMRRYNRLAIDVAEKQAEIIDANAGTIPTDINRQLMKYVNNYDLFDDDERKEIERFMGEAEKTAPKTAEDYLKMKGLSR